MCIYLSVIQSRKIKITKNRSISLYLRIITRKFTRLSEKTKILKRLFKQLFDLEKYAFMSQSSDF